MNNNDSRRSFIKKSALASGLAFMPFAGILSKPLKEEVKFKMGINPGAIGVQLDQNQLLDKAAEYGFESIA